MTVALLAAFTAVCVGLAIIWANPKRKVNLLVGTCSFHGAVWLFLLHATRTAEVGLPWLRSMTAIGAYVPIHLWFVMLAIAGRLEFDRWKSIRPIIFLTVACTVLSALCFTYYFIPAHSTAERPVVGWGYYVYIIGTGLIYLLLIFRAFYLVRGLTGLPRLEMQVWMMGGAVVAFSVIVLMAARAFFGFTANLQPLIVLTFFCITALAVTTSRIFDARHLFIIGMQRVVLVLAVAAFAYGGFHILGRFIPAALAFLLMTGLALWLAALINTRLDRWFLRYPKAVQARSAAFAAAQREMRTQELRQSFSRVLRGWGQAEHALILSAEAGDFEGGGLRLAEDDPVATTLRDMAWATPERLTRERETPERLLLREFLQQHDLGCLVMTRGPTLTVMVGVGVRPSRRPYTFPEVNQLRELASIFESALSRTHLLAKAQRAEQLATVGLIGAGVAHEIRNPLVTIKTFVQLLPKHYQEAAFRERFFRLIGDEVERIDRLTEQLMDLAAPKNYQSVPVDLHAVIESAMEIALVRAEERSVELKRELHARPCVVLGDVAALKQVVLNLTFNAIQAHEPNTSGRWVRLETLRHADNTLQLIVTDNGPGIPPDLRNRLFEPFNSTKSSGFGLGLTVCTEILSSLNATISVDPPEAGRGATFRVHLQCPPHSS